MEFNGDSASSSSKLRFFQGLRADVAAARSFRLGSMTERETRIGTSDSPSWQLTEPVATRIPREDPSPGFESKTEVGMPKKERPDRRVRRVGEEPSFVEEREKVARHGRQTSNTNLTRQSGGGQEVRGSASLNPQGLDRAVNESVYCLQSLLSGFATALPWPR